MLFKKFLAVASALCIMGALSACGDSSSKPAESSKEESSQSAETTEATTAAPVEQTDAPTTTTTEEPLPDPVDGAITFDTPSLYTASAGTDTGSAKVNLDVVDLNGDKKLRVQVLDKDDKGNYLIPKIIFDLPALLGAENVHNIGKISADLTCVARDVFINEEGAEMMCVGNFIGTFGSTLSAEKINDADGNLIQNNWAQNDFSFSEWESPVKSWHFDSEFPIKKLPINNYAENGEGTNLLIMRWGQPNQVDFYIDNLTFFDKDGNVMPLVFDAEGAKVEVKQDSTDAGAAPADTPAETTAPADTTAAAQ